MTRYAEMFDRLRVRSEGAFGAFLMLGDPDPETSAELLDALVAGGADMIEVGIPFSDPIADGPVVQAAAQRALAGGIKVADCFELIAGFRSRHASVPIGILTYASLVMADPGFMPRAANAGCDSLLIADIPSIEAEPYVQQAGRAGLAAVLIAAANTPDTTIQRIAAMSKAYTYCVSRAGITGTHSPGRFDACLIRRLKGAGAPHPVFGFGISEPGHVRSAMEAGASGVISGSAIISAAAASGFSPTQVAARVATLKSATLPMRSVRSDNQSC